VACLLALMVSASTRDICAVSNWQIIKRSNYQFFLDFEDDCGDGSDETNCDRALMMGFEDGLGKWGSKVFKQWTISQPPSLISLRLGPSYDHTSGKIG